MVAVHPRGADAPDAITGLVEFPAAPDTITGRDEVSAAPAATTEVAATAGDATTGLAVPENPDPETLVEVEGDADSTGGLTTRDLGGADEAADAGAIDCDDVAGVDAGAAAG